MTERTVQKAKPRVPPGTSKKTNAPLPDPQADRMKELLTEGYRHEKKGEYHHVPEEVATNKNYDSLRVSDNGGISVRRGDGILVRHEIEEKVGSRGIPSAGGEVARRPGNYVNNSQLGRDLCSTAPEPAYRGLRVNPDEPKKISRVFMERPDGENGMVDPNDKSHRPLFKKVPGRTPDNLGVGKELPLVVERRLVKDVPEKIQGSLTTGPQEPLAPHDPPKKNTGPMMTSLGIENGIMVPVRAHDIRNRKAADDTPEAPPETTDHVYKTQNALFNRRPAPFAQGTQIGGGVKHKPLKKCEKRGIGPVPFAVGEPDPVSYTAEEKMARVKPVPFGTGIVGPGESCEGDSLADAQAKHRIAKAQKPRGRCPFALNDDTNADGPTLDDIAKKGRITKARREVAPAPFATVASKDVSDSATSRKTRAQRPPPFATGGIWDDGYVHKPAAAAAAPTSSPGTVAAPAVGA